MEDKVLETVVNSIEYEFREMVLIKPLPPVMIEKEIVKQVPTGEKDEEGFEKYDTETTTEKVESNFGLGIILAIPHNQKAIDANHFEYNIGDTIVYNKKFVVDFDLFKDSKLVKLYDIVGKKK